MEHFETLGDVFAPSDLIMRRRRFAKCVLNAVFTVLTITFAVVTCLLALEWHNLPPVSDQADSFIVAIGVLCATWLALSLMLQIAKKRLAHPKLHPLIGGDRQNFMRDLRLDQKTVIFDGSNIYHFGRDNGVDAQPLGMLAHALREEGYRIVCFFDANIFFTLTEHGGVVAQTRHSFSVLADIFGLEGNEIYVVPSGVQADGYVLESLKYLPISFAVTNDRFRDYEALYPAVMKSNQWRKGVVFSKGEVKLLQHRFSVTLKIDRQ